MFENSFHKLMLASYLIVDAKGFFSKIRENKNGAFTAFLVTLPLMCTVVVLLLGKLRQEEYGFPDMAFCYEGAL